VAVWRRSANSLEQVDKEIRRQTDVVGIFPDQTRTATPGQHGSARQTAHALSHFQQKTTCEGTSYRRAARFGRSSSSSSSRNGMPKSPTVEI
jgi:Transposase, Mutator family